MDLTTDLLEVCEPIKSFEELWAFVEDPPEWSQYTVDIFPRSNVVVQNSKDDCHVTTNNFVPKTRLDRRSTPRTLVCHDMMSGYLEDKYVASVRIGNKYTFYRWSQIDVFVYFSHHFITIPPLCWTNIAHRNGVKILGTFITEWKDGEQICEEILESTSAIVAVVKALVDICMLYKFDGWLLNVENTIKDPEKLQYFVKHLSDEIHRRKPGSLIIWYDSVTNKGELKWQNELNDSNRCYFDVCDGIFLNYSWNETNLSKSFQSAEHRYLDVYVGIDVFGRNMYGGGKFNTYKAFEKVRENNLSVAMFAQGWTYETIEKEPLDSFLERFLDRDNAFWKSIWPFLYTHPVTGFFHTMFYTGTDKEWYKLLHQDQQLSKCLHPRSITPEYRNAHNIRETCNCMQLHYLQNTNNTCCFLTQENLPPQSDYVHHLFSCDIPLTGTAVLYVYTKKTNKESIFPCLEIILLTQNINGSLTKIYCKDGQENEAVNPENSVSCVECFPNKDPDLVHFVSYQNAVPIDWDITCYKIHFVSSRIIEIGAKLAKGVSSVYICGFGIKQADMFNS